jgi:mycothiol synthase
VGVVSHVSGGWAIRTGAGSAISADDARQLHLVESECEHLVAPAFPVRSATDLLGWFAHPPTGARRQIWVCTDARGESLGAAWLSSARAMPGQISVLVRPACRRQDVGTALLAEVTAHARNWGVTSLLGACADPDSLSFATTRGWVAGRSHVRQLFPLPLQNPPAVRPPAGLTVESWVGAAPADLLDSFALARNAINDSPADEDEDETWTAERVRDLEASVAARDSEQHVTVVLNGPEVVAFTEIRVSREAGSPAGTDDTAVVRAFRRRGVATWLKRESLQRLSAARPDVTQLTTVNESTNVGMLAVNRLLGGQPVWTRTQVRLDLLD